MNEQTNNTAIKPFEQHRAALTNPRMASLLTSIFGGNKIMADQYIGSILALLAQDAQLQNCKTEDIIKVAVEAASLQLPINKALGKAYIICYNQSTRMPDGTWQKIPTPTFVIGYKGLIELAHRTGILRTLNRGIVHEGELAGHDMLSGRFYFDASQKISDNIIGYFAYLETTSGYSQTIYLTVEEMAQYAKRFSPSVSKNTTVEQLVNIAQQPQFAQSGKQGWEGNFTAMALKTVTRRLLIQSGLLSISAKVDYGDGAVVDEQTPVSNDTEFVKVQTIDVDTIEPKQPNTTTVQPPIIDPNAPF